MKPYVLAIPLVLSYAGLKQKKSLERKELQLPGTGRKVFHFYPTGKNPESLPGVYIQHGMSALGIDDPRILELAENIASSNHSVLLPELPEVKGLRIEEKTISNIQDLMLEIHSTKRLFNGNDLGYLSASFSGGMGLIAASKSNTRNKIKSSMAIGAYCDFLDTVPFVFSNYKVDPYAVYVILYNFLHRFEVELAEELQSVYYVAALDNGLKRTGTDAQSKSLLEKTSRRAKEFFYQVEIDGNFRNELAKRVLATVPKNLPENLSPFYQLETLEGPVSLLHGKTDPVISPEESEKLTRLFQKKGISYVYRSSTALTHGDSLPLHSQIFGVPALLQTFGSFLYWLDR
ncbi:alpha/beta hydrolase [Leptospira congkakensis]|uniref:Alpha/beta hydrolase n=1 Tax=Leptospira congkakensis TaxID=2484932 RepID=A0A4Z1ANW5_9LEPT|nr:alpha/beta hydrolase [Leptospira congkakensis]TGL85590.1 alpha/beta hydrolase [Leptospira congkakensis]TGL92349.1 alpha/beta hydrolase [Leptospira congkakensis]TGM00095.1 alpha/beta hydrolase [Leptospira congkakensis]